jgi:hypothetical protein
MTTKKIDPQKGWMDLLQDLNDIGRAHEDACRELEAELAANPHRDKVAARNTLTLKYCGRLVTLIAISLEGPGFSLCQRLANALSDRSAEAEPGLFFNIEQQQIDLGGNRSGITVGARTQGLAALALDDLIEGGFKKKEAEAWLDIELKNMNIRDAGGDLLTGRRISVWRDHFRLGRGSKHGRLVYNEAKRRDAMNPLTSRQIAEQVARETLMGVRYFGDHQLPKAQRR